MDFETFTCEAGTGNLEVDLTSLLTAEAGNGTFNGNDFENSGLRSDLLPTASPASREAADPWDLKFGKKSPQKGYEVHLWLPRTRDEGVRGRQVVRRVRAGSRPQAGAHRTHRGAYLSAWTSTY